MIVLMLVGLILTVDDNKVTKVRGNKEHPATRGTLCPKMAHYDVLFIRLNV